jgi:hypothetical protein
VEAIDEKIKLPQKPCFLFQVVWHQEVKGTGNCLGLCNVGRKAHMMLLGETTRMAHRNLKPRSRIKPWSVKKDSERKSPRYERPKTLKHVAVKFNV